MINRRDLILLSTSAFSGILIPEAWAIASNYERAIANILVSEGGAVYTNVPGDPGGPTKYGITIHDVRSYLKAGASAEDVKHITEAQARSIYRKHYADVVGFDLLPAGLDYAVLDYAVNAGSSRAIGALKRILGLPSDPATPSTALLHLLSQRSIPTLIRALTAERMRFQMGLPARLNKFKRGWKNRITSVNTIALNMAGDKRKGFQAGTPDFNMIPRLGPGKAYEEEIVD